MGYAAVEIPQRVRVFSAERERSTKETWKAYIESRERDDPSFCPKREWGLTEWENRAARAGDISLATIDKIKAKRRRDPLFLFDFFLFEVGLTSNQLADKLDEEAENERLRLEARQNARKRVALRLATPAASDRSFAPVEKRGRS